ncbi:hypothetical protein [Sinorhizobium meliloti]|uniref:hypothetical protein n=1 Tax=Rhizobium meliloti TaxID=382 RepID=UPI002380593A|nr:hypothetical protein [Sinorhizobium meliloti]MDE3819706.1 hypothetical protein [Sinorhizobium meliloti]
MSRVVLEGFVFGDGLDLAVFKLGAGKNAELVAGPEERDRHHQVRASWKAWFCSCERSDIWKLHLWSGPFPPDGSRQCPAQGAITAQAKTKRRQLGLPTP